VTRWEPVLIGPAFVGKTTVGALLASRLSCPFVDLDEIGDIYYRAVGQPLSAFRGRIEAIGYSDAHRWWQPARVAAVRGALADHRGSVVALGAGHSHYEDATNSKMVQDALAPFINVVLMLPSPDPAVSLKVLRRRAGAASGHGWERDGHDWLRDWVGSAQNRSLATRTVFTARRSAGSVARDIESSLSRPPVA
jgi:hypothetical protein